MTASTKPKVAIVTGATGGIGFACAAMLAREGYAVVAQYRRNEPYAAKLLADIEARGGQAIALQADLAVPQEVKGVVEHAVKRFGRLDALVNCAGISGPQQAEGEAESIQEVLSINVVATLVACNAAASHMTKSGAIVNVSSINARHPVPGMTAYSASKGAVEAMTRALALELAPQGIRVNAVAPGPTDTAMLRAIAPPEAVDAICAQTPLERRLAHPDDIASVVSFLLSDDARWVTGQCITASGGLVV